MSPQNIRVSPILFIYEVTYRTSIGCNCVCYYHVDTALLLVTHVSSEDDPGSREETPPSCRTIEGVGGEDTTGNIENLLRQSSKEGVSNVGREGSKEETLTCEDGVSDVSNVGFSEYIPKNGPSANCSNETSAVVIGAQKYMITTQIQTTLISFSAIIPPQCTLEPTQPTSPTPTENVI